MSRTLILGLGNPILRDDGIGWRVVQEVAQRLAQPAPSAPPSLEIDYASLGGISLMERLIGYDRAILVDAIQTRDGVPGTIYRLTPEDLPTRHANAAHDATLKAALGMGRDLGAALPAEIVIIAVEAHDVREFGETLSPAVAAAVGPAAQAVLAALNL
jgi:hydrogenase maturation protease